MNEREQKLIEQQQLYRRVRCLQLACARAGLLLFALVFLSHLLGDPFAPFHRQLCASLSWAAEPGRRLLGALPREHGKTTLGTVALVLRELCLGRKKNILLVAANAREAAAKLRQITGELETNERLRSVFGARLRPARDLQGHTVAYADGEIVLAGGARISTLGFGGKVRGQLTGGRRLDLVILDDPEDDALVSSPRRREKMRRWADMALLPALDVGQGSLVWLGTLLHHDSVLAQWLAGRDKVQGIRGKQTDGRSSAPNICEQEPASACPLPLTPYTCQQMADEPESNWHVLRLSALDDQGEPLWPARWSVERLEQRRMEIGDAAFAQEYLNQPVSLAGQLFRATDFRTYDLAGLRYEDGEWSIEGSPKSEVRSPKTNPTGDSHWTSDFGPRTSDSLLVAIGVDPAIRQSEEADWFAAVAIGIAQAEPSAVSSQLSGQENPAAVLADGCRLTANCSWRIYVLDVLRLRAPFGQQLDALARFADHWLPRVIGIEAVAYQEALAQAALDRGLPVRALKGTHPKAVRIAAASVHATQGRLYLPLSAAWVADFRGEAEEYPAGRHDDQLDALARALEAGLPLVQGAGDIWTGEARRQGVGNY